jgi:hypothetical protein
MSNPVKGEKSLALMQRSLLRKQEEDSNTSSHHHHHGNASTATTTATATDGGSNNNNNNSNNNNNNNPLQQQQQQQHGQDIHVSPHIPNSAAVSDQVSGNPTNTAVRSKGKDIAQLQRLSPDKFSTLQKSPLAQVQLQPQPPSQPQPRETSSTLPYLQQTQPTHTQTQHQQQPQQYPASNAAVSSSSSSSSQGTKPNATTTTIPAMKSKGKDFASMMSRAPPSVHAAIDLNRQNAARKAAGLPPILPDVSSNVITTTASTASTTTHVALAKAPIPLATTVGVVGSMPISHGLNNVVPAAAPSLMGTGTNSTNSMQPLGPSQIMLENQQSVQGSIGSGGVNVGSHVDVSLMGASASSVSTRVQQPQQSQSQHPYHHHHSLQDPSQSMMSVHATTNNQNNQMTLQLPNQPTEIKVVKPKPTPKPTKVEGCMSVVGSNNLGGGGGGRQQSLALRVKLSNMLKSMDPSGLFSLEADAEEKLIALANDFANNLVKKSTKIANHGHLFDRMADDCNDGNKKKRKCVVEVDDVAFVLKKNYGMTIPGLPSSKSSNKRDMLSSITTRSEGVCLATTSRVLVGSASIVKMNQSGNGGMRRENHDEIITAASTTTTNTNVSINHGNK